MNSFLSGYNMNFRAKCTFDDNQDCTGGLSQEITSPNFTFPISFVTSDNRIVHSFPIDRYFLMLDTMGYMRIEKVEENYDVYLNESQKAPMEKVATWKQNETLGCLVDTEDHFAKLIQINVTSIIPQYYKFIIFLI